MPKRRIEPTTRKILLTSRLIALWTGVLIIAGPSWTRETNHTQSDIVPIILDVSASMSIIEQGDSSRFDALVSVVSTLNDEAQQLTPSTHRRVDWFTFTDTIGGELVDVDGDILIPPPAGGPSMIGDAISEIINGLDGDRVAGVVLISDGRGPIGEVEAQLRRIGVGVWVIPIGDTNPPPEISLHNVIAPRTAFSEDNIPLQVVLKHTNNDDNFIIPVTIQVIDEINGTKLMVVDQLVEANSLTQTPITIEPNIPGMARWRVEVWNEGRLLDSTIVEVDIRDHPLRILYVEGKPRYFYRFMVPLLTRDQSIDVSILLQSADEDAAPVGDHPIRRFPKNKTELEPFDLVVFGDVDPRGFTQGQLDALHTHLISGAGLLWIPGSKTNPNTWADTPLEPLLPIPPTAQQHIVQGKLTITPEGESLGLPTPMDAPLAWAIAVDEYQPQARELMQLTSTDGLVWPGFLLLPTGLGHAGWLATDDIWRWRRIGTGDHDGSLLLGLIRLLARNISPEDPMLRVIPQPIIGQPTTILLECDVSTYTEVHKILEVDVLDIHGVLRQRVQLLRDIDANTGRYVSWRGLWQPESSGTRQLIVSHGDQPLQQTITVLPNNTEDMRPGVDLDQLNALATNTGGELIDNATTVDVLGMIPRRSSKAIHISDEGPALTWLLWSILMVVLTIEWSVRRWNALA